jgi:hypothetical protein
MHKTNAHQLNSLDPETCLLKNRGKGSDWIWFSQYDMAATQMGFIGLFVLHPDKCGMHSISDHEMMEVVYLWRVIGYLNGVEDRFNICSSDSLEETRYLFHQITYHNIMPVVTKSHPFVRMGREMANDVVKSLLPHLRMNGDVLVKYWHNILGFKSVIELNHMKDKLYYFIVYIALNFVLRISLVNRYLKHRIRRRLGLLVENQAKLEAKLRLEDNSEKYGVNVITSMGCFWDSAERLK